MGKPQVYTWFVVYCVLMAIMYLFVAALGIFYPMLTEMAGKDGRMEGQVMGIIYTLSGIIFFIPFAIAPFLKPGPGVWIYDLVLICLGMTSCCCLPITIPLLIFWIKPEVKNYFGRQ